MKKLKKYKDRGTQLHDLMARIVTLAKCIEPIFLSFTIWHAIVTVHKLKPYIWIKKAENKPGCGSFLAIPLLIFVVPILQSPLARFSWSTGEDTRFQIEKMFENRHLIANACSDIFSHNLILIKYHQLLTISANNTPLPQTFSLECEV